MTRRYRGRCIRLMPAGEEAAGSSSSVRVRNLVLAIIVLRSL
jgi:hypothetical protein